MAADDRCRCSPGERQRALSGAQAVRLNAVALANPSVTAASELRWPGYDREAIQAGVVHLGIGAFHRAHQAVYFDDLLARDPRWGITGVSLRNAATQLALRPQDGLYMLCTPGSDRVIGSVLDVLTTVADEAGVLARLTHPATRLVTLTVTEKGYYHHPSSGGLDIDSPAIQSDLATDGALPVTTIGWLARALRLRRDSRAPRLTILSCDNLAANGATLRRLVHEFVRAQAADRSGDSDWVDDAAAFPSSMVDRIVPATTDGLRAELEARSGLKDAWPVRAEAFSQWVIEDDWAGEVPELAPAVEFVRDVEPYERMKLWMLNASHSALAYLGYLAGHETIGAAMAVPAFERFVDQMMAQEVEPVLGMPATVDVAAYRRQLIERFKAPGIEHRTWQIAMDGSQKLPPRILQTLRRRLARGLPSDRLLAAVAGWIRYAAGRDEAGDVIDVRDPLADELRALAADAGTDPSALASAFVAMEPVFGTDLPANAGFVEALAEQLGKLYRDGAAGVVAALARDCG